MAGDCGMEEVPWVLHNSQVKSVMLDGVAAETRPAYTDIFFYAGIKIAYMN